MEATEIKSCIQKIANAVINSNIGDKQGLYSGSAGAALFLFNAYKHGIIQDDYGLYKLIANCVSSVQSWDSFAGGNAGINWFFRYLIKQGSLNKNDWENIELNKKMLYDNATDCLRQDNYDLLHGGTGILYSILFDANNHQDKKQIELANQQLQKIMNKNALDSVPFHYDFNNNCLDYSMVNMGLAHGLPGILKYLLICCQKGVALSESLEQSKKIVEYIVRHINPEDSKYSFPHLVGCDIDEYSRLAWCYGDLSIGYILLQAGQLFNDHKLSQFAENIIIKTVERNTHADAGVVDAGVCHGSSGVSYLYYKAWRLTRNSKLKKAADFWLSETLQYAQSVGDEMWFSAYNSTDKRYEKNMGLLEGSSGVGLVLLSYLTNDTAWDYSIMLD